MAVYYVFHRGEPLRFDTDRATLLLSTRGEEGGTLCHWREFYQTARGRFISVERFFWGDGDAREVSKGKVLKQLMRAEPAQRTAEGEAFLLLESEMAEEA